MIPIEDLNEFEKLLLKKTTQKITDEENERLEQFRNQDAFYKKILSKIENVDYIGEQYRLYQAIDFNKAWRKNVMTRKNNGRKKLFVRLLPWLAACLFLLVSLHQTQNLFKENKEAPILITDLMPIASNNVKIVTQNASYEISDTCELAFFEKAISNETTKNIKHKIIKLEVGFGQNFSFHLPDGSFVCMNAGSTLEYPVNFRAEKREVKLNGEAYFEVAKNEEKPFVVIANKHSVNVLGTIFNIESYKDAKLHKLTLVEGMLGIDNEKNACILKPNQQVVFSNTNFSLIKKEVDASNYTAWMKEKFQFNNASLSEMALSLSRWYGIPITTPKEHNKSFSGSFPRFKDINDALKIISLSAKVEIQIKKDRIIIK